MVSCLKRAKRLWTGARHGVQQPGIGRLAASAALRAVGLLIVWSCGWRARCKAAALALRPALHMPLLVACALVIPPLATVVSAPTAHAQQLHPASGSAGAAPLLKVQGNQLVDIRSTPPEPIQLHGVDRSGTEYACIQGWGIFDGPSDTASVLAIASWNENAVRVPLNEDCWLVLQQQM